MTLQSIQFISPLQQLANAIERLTQNFTDQRTARAAYNKTLSELSEMSSRELNDIGIDRSDIAQIAAQAAAMK